MELTSPIHYSKDGKEVECNHIELLEPNGKVSTHCMAIESLIQSGLMAMSEKLSASDIEKAKEAAKSDDKEPMTADAFLALLNSAGEQSEKIVLHFREIFKVRAMMGGEKAITESRLDEMSHKDLKRMIGEYGANFIMS